MNAAHRSLLLDFINLPTAPFTETAPLSFIRAFVRNRPALSLREDESGNLRVRYRRGRATVRRPVLFAGHLDHPGFVAQRMIDARTLRAVWRGGVRPEYFPGARVRFWSNGRRIAGRIVETYPSVAAASRRRAAPARRSKAARRWASSAVGVEPPDAVHLHVPREIAPGSVGMWDLPDAQVRGNLLRSRACDDVAGVAAILCALDHLCRTRAAGECWALFTRAEEVGFGGALAACAAGFVPRRCVVVAVECSRVIPGVTMGGGPVLRVGDKATIFTPGATAFCRSVAEDLGREDSSFTFQRKLMDGGTCESTVYCHYGYGATGICLPLLNYHNMDTDRRRLAPEIIDLRDFEGLVKWFIALARSGRRYDGSHPGLGDRLESLQRRHRPMLLRSRIRPPRRIWG